MDKPVVIPLARDTVLTSLRDGSEAIYWMSDDQIQASLGGRGIRLVTTIAEITPNSAVSVFGQYSYDKKTWTNFARNIDGMTSGYTTVGSYTANYANSPAEFGPYVRYGIQVKRTTAGQAQVRLTSTAIVLFSNVTSVYGILSGSAALSATSTPTVVAADTTFDASNYDEGQVFVSYSGNPTSLQFTVWTSPDGGTTWGKVGEALAVTGAPNSGEAIYIPLAYLGSAMQVRYTMASGTSITCTAIQFIGRVN